MASSVQHRDPRSIGVRTAAGSLVAIAALLAAAGVTRADSECTTSFERWSKLSASRSRMQQAAAGTLQQEACLQSEAVRADLLQALAKTRSLCDGAPWLDQSAKQTKEMIDINASVIGSMPLCRTEEQQPAKAVEPDPTPPRPQMARPRACLDITQAGPERFVLANRKCGGRSVLAVIEKKGPSGKIDCKGYTIGRQLAVATLKDERPQINYQCVLDEGNCNKSHVATIFPECDW